MSALYDMVQSHIDEALANLYTSLPAKIDKIGKVGTVTVISCTPLINRIYQEGYAEEDPAIEDVPIIWPSGGGFHITCPLEVGDVVMLHFTMRSAMEMKNSDGKKAQTPTSKRLHNIMDAFAVPCIHPYKSPLVTNDTDMSIGSDSMEIIITKSGNIEFGKGATEKLVLGDKFLELYNALSVPTGVGPSGPPIVLMDATLQLSAKVTTE